jgi:hypothetical protein
MRLTSLIQAGLMVPALVAAIATSALVAVTVECPRLAQANSSTESPIATSEPELICSPEAGIPPDEPHGASRREVKAPLAEVLHCPLAFAGVHLRKDRPEESRVAYHFCKAVNDNVCQCILYDGVGPDARLIGIEYLVTDEIYRQMPTEEQAYWHDHKYEVDSRLLRSLTQSGAEEAATLAKVRTLWGKVYHTWVSGQDYPQGPARLFWSVTGEEPLVLPREAKLPPELKGARLAPDEKPRSGGPGEGHLETGSEDRDGAGIRR